MGVVAAAAWACGIGPVYYGWELKLFKSDIAAALGQQYIQKNDSALRGLSFQASGAGAVAWYRAVRRLASQSVLLAPTMMFW